MSKKKKTLTKKQKRRLQLINMVDRLQEKARKSGDWENFLQLSILLFEEADLPQFADGCREELAGIRLQRQD